MLDFGYRKPIILKIKDSSFVELVKEVFGVFICNLLLNSIFNEFPNRQYLATKSACSDLTKIDTLYKKKSDRPPSNFNRGVIQHLRQGGTFFGPSPVIGGLTWSHSFALAERAALSPCNPRILGHGND